jgi:serine/threonine-protein kinase
MVADRDLAQISGDPIGGLLPSRIGPYAVEALIGTGGMAFVLRVRDEHGTARAMKVLRTGSATQVARFEAEGIAMDQFTHPHVPAVHDFGYDAARRVHYLVQELAERGSASDAVNARGPLPPHEVAVWVIQALCALDAVHARGIVHRDVKPGNLLLTGDGRVLLGDFGIASVPGFEIPVPDGSILGSPAFMPPEQQERPNDASPGIDLYAAGATLYALATRTRPVGLSEAGADDPTWTALPHGLRHVTIKATRADPAERYATAREMAADLVPLLPAGFLDDHPHLARWLAA